MDEEEEERGDATKSTLDDEETQRERGASGKREKKGCREMKKLNEEKKI